MGENGIATEPKLNSKQVTRTARRAPYSLKYVGEITACLSVCSFNRRYTYSETVVRSATLFKETRHASTQDV